MYWYLPCPGTGPLRLLWTIFISTDETKMAPKQVNRKEQRTGTSSINNSAEVLLRQIGLSTSQEEEALASCRQHLVSSAADLVLIYKRGELKDLFPQLGLHARIEARLKQRSVALAKTCLLDTTASTITSANDHDDDDDDDDNDNDVAELRRDTEKADNEVRLESLVRDWFHRTKRKVIRFVNEHRCST